MFICSKTVPQNTLLKSPCKGTDKLISRFSLSWTNKPRFADILWPPGPHTWAFENCSYRNISSHKCIFFNPNYYSNWQKQYRIKWLQSMESCWNGKKQIFFKDLQLGFRRMDATNWMLFSSLSVFFYWNYVRPTFT